MNAKNYILYIGARQAVKLHYASAKKNTDSTKATGASNTTTKKLDKGLKPFILTKDHTPADLHIWEQELMDYFESGDFHLSSCIPEDNDRKQKAHFARCVNEDLLKTIKAKTDLETTVFGHKGYIETLRKVFETLYPIFYRRVQLFHIRQNGEDHLSYMERIC